MFCGWFTNFMLRRWRFHCCGQSMLKRICKSFWSYCISKSQIDYGDLSDAAKWNIKNLIGFNSMKVKCQSSTWASPSKLSVSDCLPLIERIKARVQRWTGKYLLYAGQLVKSALFSMQVYWSTVFILPVQVFIWRQEDLQRVLMVWSWYG